MKTILMVLACVLCNSLAQLALRQGAAAQGSGIVANPLSPAAWGSVLFCPPVVAGLALWTLSTLLWIYVLSGSGLILAYGLYGLNYVLVPLLAHWRLAEPISGLQAAGMALIALGVGCTVAGREAA